jgi:hypothetical protein
MFDTDSGEVVATFVTGYWPDMVCFSPDGGRVLVANEGEPGESDPSGSITVLDLARVRRSSDVASLGGSRLETVDFEPGSLARGVSLEGLRIAPALRDRPWVDIEPECIAPDAEGAWVSLQENNALARYDYSARAWTRMVPLGSIVQTVDASDDDGGIHIDDAVAGLLMPDGVASYAAGERRYVVTANEGDSRNHDQTRLADASLDPVALARLLATYRDPREPAALGRLFISSFDGDDDGDGDIDSPTMLGTRSFSIFDAETGDRVYDSGSTLEVLVATLAPEVFNSDGDPATFDSRSDDRGPEPEGIALASLGGRHYLFVTLERCGGVAMFDVTDPSGPGFIDYAPAASAPDRAAGPEGVAVIKLGSEVFVAIGAEQSGTIEMLRVNLAKLGRGAPR